DSLTTTDGPDAAPRNPPLAEHVARIRDVDALHGPIEMARLLIRKLMKHAVAILDVFGGRNVVQMPHRQRSLDSLTAALDHDVHLLADGRVELRVEWHELRDQLAVDLDQDVASMALRPTGRTQNHTRVTQ